MSTRAEALTEQQHTPGPWTVEPYGDSKSPALVIHSDHANRVCFMATTGNFGPGRAEIEANARLIAAAPDMLAALKAAAASCQRFLDTFGEVGDDATQADINDWHEIIRKAGESG